MASASFEPLSAAINEFKEGLTPAQRAELLKHSGKPDATSILAFTAKIDKANANRRSRCVSSRLFGILQSVQDFSSVADTFISAHPEIAALVWGSLKFTILIANNVLSFFDKLSEVLLKVSLYCPRYSEYRLLFTASPRLQKALCSFYASVVKFCSKALYYLERPASTLANAIWSPFEREFKEFNEKLREEHDSVKAEIELASEIEAAKERAAANAHRKSTSKFQLEVNTACKESTDWRLRRQEQEIRVEKEKLLEKLSAYNYVSSLKRMRKKRHGETGSWLSRTQTFTDWLEDESSGALWLSGIVGSGKSVVTAAAVSALLSQERDFDEHIAFFFCEYDNAESLKSRTIFGSLIRQCLSVDKLSTTVEAMLRKLFENTSPDTEDLEPILEEIAKSSQSINLVIDGFDECAQEDRMMVLKVLQHLISSQKKLVKVFISSREDVIRDIGRTFDNCRELNMNCAETRGDILKYVKEVVREKIEIGELVVGDRGLIEDIQQALAEGANGMFLWVVFQIKDLCRETCDADLRKALAKLPRDLSQTYNRILIRILNEGKEHIVQNVLRWVGIARRPLRLGELREAIAIQPEDEYLQRDRLVNDPDGIITWCNNLIVVDDEDQVVQFAHHSVGQFLLSEASGGPISRFHFQRQKANFMAGVACVTYLNFNDFERQVALPLKPSIPIQPKDIADATTRGSSRLAKYMIRLAEYKSGYRGDSDDDFRQDITRFGQKSSNTEVGSLDLVQLQYPFLVYAREFWLSHSANLLPKHARSWTFWQQLISYENTLALKPWSDSNREAFLIKYIIAENHLALAAYAAELCLTSSTVLAVLLGAIRYGYLELVRQLLQGRVDIEASGTFHSNAAEVFERTPLELASSLGRNEIIKLLLDNGAKIMTRGVYYCNALEASIREGGHETKTTALLLNRGAIVNRLCGHGNALLMASAAGQYETVLLLLKFNAEINVHCKEWGTALGAATFNGHRNVVELLLEHRADPNVEADLGSAVSLPMPRRGPPLHNACQLGFLAIARMLIRKGAHVGCLIYLNSQNVTPLMIASEHGHEEIVELLLENGANLDTVGLNGSALALASRWGHINIVKILLEAGADVNATEPKDFEFDVHFKSSEKAPSPAAYFLASQYGHEEIAKLLLNHGAQY